MQLSLISYEGNSVNRSTYHTLENKCTYRSMSVRRFIHLFSMMCFWYFKLMSYIFSGARVFRNPRIWYSVRSQITSVYFRGKYYWLNHESYFMIKTDLPNCDTCVVVDDGQHLLMKCQEHALKTLAIFEAYYTRLRLGSFSLG